MTKISIILTILLLVATQSEAPEAMASGVTLRSVIMVRGDMVRLSDLFTGLQPGQDCDIGPSPAPGKRIVIPPGQLAAIASEFGIDWQPNLAYQATTLERLARTVTRDEVLAVLRPALIGNGASPDSDFSLGSFVAPMLPIDMKSPPEIQALDLDTQTGRFSAVMFFPGSQSDGLTMRVVGRAEQQIDVVALTHTLPPGARLAAGDLQLIRVRLNGLRGVPLTAIADADGMVLKRSAGDGTPLLRDMLIRPMLIDRGRPVVLRLQSAGLQLTAAGTALEAGASGDRIHVVNSLSRAILVGQITDSAEIEIDPATAPVVGQAIGGQNGLPKVPDAIVAGRYAQEAQYR